MAVRNRTGERNEVKMLDRNVRRYWSHRCSKTRLTVELRRAPGELGRARAVTIRLA
jgi:hypothetical protein